MQPANFLFPLIIIAAFYLLFLRPSRQRQQTAQRMRDRVVPGARVMTTAGLYATVVSVEHDDERGEDVVVLETAPGVVSSWSRAAVGRVFDDPDAAGDADPVLTDEIADRPDGGSSLAAGGSSASPAGTDLIDETDRPEVLPPRRD